MRSDNFGVGLFGGIVFILLAQAIVGLIAGVLPYDGWRLKRDAIKAGAAYYDCDQKTGDCKFTWGQP